MIYKKKGIKQMKKIISLLLVLMLVFSLAACGAPATEETQPGAVVEETGVS